jgi:hypothetical protein
MQDLVSERDQSWVTGDAILHTLIIPQSGKIQHVHCDPSYFTAVKSTMCGVTIGNFCLCPKIVNCIGGIMLACSPRVRNIVGQVKPKTMKLVFVASPLSTRH